MNNKSPHVSSYAELKQHCDVPVYLYSIPSNKVTSVIPYKFSADYDRWEIIVNRCLQYGLEFTIDSNIAGKHGYSSLAEIYHILHIDKCIDSFINIRYNNKEWKIQPGIKRFLMVDHLPLSDVKFISFNKPIKTAKPYLKNVLVKTHKLLSTNLGYELQDPVWRVELEKRLKNDPIRVRIISNKIYMNNILFFERKTYKSKWELVYENTNIRITR